MTSIIKGIFGKPKAGAKKSKYVEDESIPQTPFILSSLFYLSVVLFIGIPVWHLTCSPTRYSLPNFINLESSLVDSPPSLHLDISIIKLVGYDLPDFNDQVNSLRNNLPPQIKTSTENVTFNINWRVRRPTLEESKLFKSHPVENAFAEGQTRAALEKLEHDLLKIHKSEYKFRLFMYIIDESYYPAFCDPKRAHTYTLSFERFAYLCPSYATSSSKNDQKPILNLVNQVLEEVYMSMIDIARLKRIQSSQTDLLFSLLPEKAESIDRGQLRELSDKLIGIFTKNVKEKFKDLAEIVNIKVITQNIICLIDSDSINKMLENPIKRSQQVDSNATDDVQDRVIEVRQLSKLFHEYDSKVASHSSQYVSRALVIVPDAAKGQLSMNSDSKGQFNILEGQDSGSILIARDDKSLVLGLRAITRRLVGLSSVNLCQNCLVRRDVFFNRWELDSIMGVLTSLKLQGVHSSLKSLSDQTVGLRISKEISKMAKESNSLALESIEHLRKKRTLEAYRLASQAYELSEAAYFDPSLIGQPSFPDELKYAVYLPLFFPLAIPLVKALVILIKYLLSRSPGQQEKLKSN